MVLSRPPAPALAVDEVGIGAGIDTRGASLSGAGDVGDTGAVATGGVVSVVAAASPGSGAVGGAVAVGVVAGAGTAGAGGRPVVVSPGRRGVSASSWAAGAGAVEVPAMLAGVAGFEVVSVVCWAKARQGASNNEAVKARRVGGFAAHASSQRTHSPLCGKKTFVERVDGKAVHPTAGK